MEKKERRKKERRKKKRNKTDIFMDDFHDIEKQ